MTSVPQFDTFLRSIIETLERLGLPYMIGGSVASSIYGEARSTRWAEILAEYRRRGQLPNRVV